MRTCSATVGTAVAILLAAMSAHAQAPKPMSEKEVKAAGGKQLTAAESRRQLIGNTMYTMFLRDFGEAKAGSIVTVYYRDERTRKLLGAKGQKRESNWWLEGDNVCAEQTLQGRGHLCHSRWELSGTIWSCLEPSGECYLTSRIVPGNPEGL